MSYEPKIVQRASARLARRRDIRERKRYMLEQQLYKQEPRLAQLDRALRGTMVELTDLIAAGKPVFIMPTYTAMLDLRTTISKNYGFKAFWE